VQIHVGKGRLSLVEGDITEQTVDAIVNAANSGLRGGGGVDGAIHRAGGHEIMAECRRLGACPTGDARITTAGRLPAKNVIHAVGPVYRDGNADEPELLAGAYRRSLELAVEHDLASVAFPSISTGAYRYPIADAARIALRTVIETMEEHPELKEVRFVLFGPSDYDVYARVLGELA